MSDSFTEVTHKSWFTRIKNALSGVVFGFILLIASIVGLFVNEGRAVKTATALNEGAGLVVSVDANNLSTGQDGKLIHFSGSLIPEGIAGDKLFMGINAPDGATRLSRKVEMYQWKQEAESKTKKKLGGGEETITVYTYSKEWSTKAIKSGDFKQQASHENPQMPVESKAFDVDKGRVGNITLSGNQFSSLGEETPLRVNAAHRDIVRAQLRLNKPVAVSGNYISVSYSPNNPEVGDIRISFASQDVDKISVIGKLQDQKITSYSTTNGRSISMFRTGTMDAQQMFDDALSGNSFLTWILRFVGFIAMLIGFNLVFSVVGVLGDIVPFIGDVFRFATGMAAFALAAIISTLVIGFAWIYYRPVIGVSIIAVGLIIAVVVFLLGKKKARSHQSQGQLVTD